MARKQEPSSSCDVISPQGSFVGCFSESYRGDDLRRFIPGVQQRAISSAARKLVPQRRNKSAGFITEGPCMRFESSFRVMRLRLRREPGLRFDISVNIF